MLVRLILAVIFTCCLVLAAKDTSVCTSIQPAPGGPNMNVLKPNISDQFSTRIEMVIVNKNKTEYAREYFDAVNNRGFISQKNNGLRYDIWYDYATNELIGFYPDMPEKFPERCTVTDLSNSDQKFLLGYEQVNGKPHIYSASGALRFKGQGIEEIYIGTKTVRGILVDWWQSCQYWQSQNATMIVDWYFSSQTMWDSALGVRVPVQVHINGTSNHHHFEHYYNFFEFKPTLTALDDYVFETPRGVACPGRRLTQKFPNVATDAFSFTTEVLDNNKKHVSSMKESFFYSQKLVKYEYRPQLGDFAPYGYTDLVEIHDFHSGVAYITDKNRGNCSFRKIESGDFDDRTINGGNTVRIRNAKEFFYFDVDKHSTSYEGVKLNRMVECNTWVATRTDFPFMSPSNSTWEWYFATDKWSYDKVRSEAGAVPVQMRISIPERNWDYQYSLFNFKKDKPDLLKFDISGCFQIGGQRRKFQFSLNVNENTKSTISTNLSLFKYYVLQAVVSATSVSPIRVANLNVYVADVVFVTFELLDVAPIQGDVAKASDYQEVALDSAVNTIADLIQNGRFVIQLDGERFMNIKSIVAVPDSIVETTEMNSTTTTQINQVKTGYGPGPMAAVGVTMPILGAGLGLVFAYFFFK